MPLQSTEHLSDNRTVRDEMLVQIEIEHDLRAIMAMRERLGEDHHAMVCHRCEDPDRAIVALLTIVRPGVTWALCGPCASEMPQGSFEV